jgi:D-alanyl-lipoteichoic acid acyltransferase DltB (MBOAT superfamily)
MQFNSFAFGVFMSFVFLLYWSFLNHEKRIRARNGFLLLASYMFYGWWDWRFLSLIVVSSMVDFIVGARLGDFNQSDSARRRWLAVSMVVNLGFLGVFKYFNFFLESADIALSFFECSAAEWRLQWILPVGISFYTFQTLSYTIDIYRKQLKPTNDPIAFFAFVAFFPQLVAGPIERAKNLLPQFSRFHKLEEHDIKSGLILVIWGLFKKIVIADRLALYVDSAYAVGPEELSGPIALTAVVFFTLQLYVDFSAYSEIAIGLARMLGFKLSTNFRRPLLANGFADLWARWHISLTTWFRDYLMLPLRRMPNGQKRRGFNVMVVFFVTGLWHGANWTFVLWGLVNGAFLLLFEPLVIRPLYRLPVVVSRILRTGFTTIFMYGALVLFRAPDMASAATIYSAIFDWSEASLALGSRLKLSANEWRICWLGVIGLLSFEALQELKPKLEVTFFEGVGLKRWVTAWTLVMAILLIGSYGVFVLDKQFIYFQF